MGKRIQYTLLDEKCQSGKVASCVAATLQGSRENQTVVMMNGVQENGQVKGAWSVWWGEDSIQSVFRHFDEIPKIIKLKE